MCADSVLECANSERGAYLRVQVAFHLEWSCNRQGECTAERCRARQADRQSQTGRARRAEPDRQGETGTAKQAEPDSQRETTAVERLRARKERQREREERRSSYVYRQRLIVAQAGARQMRAKGRRGFIWLTSLTHSPAEQKNRPHCNRACS